MQESIVELAKWLSLICTSICLIGCVYALVAAWLVRRFALRPMPVMEVCDRVVVLKPLHGAEPDLEANLASFCTQTYPGEFEIVFGVQDAGDPAIAVVERLVAAYPARSIRLVVDPAQHGSNRKISNLINMSAQAADGREAQDDVIVLADSDMHVLPDYLTRVVSALCAPGVGAVTCLYRGDASGNVWSRLAAMAIDLHFLPSVIVGLATGLAKPCFGSTIALRRSTLHRIGGFEAFANQLADDYALGAAIADLGQTIAIPPFLVAHTCADAGYAGLFRHELRWARTIGTVDPIGFVGSGVTHALPFAILAASFGGFDAAGSALIVVALASRLILQLGVTRHFELSRSAIWLMPVRDLISFTVYLACFVTSRIDWRGQSFTVRRDGTLVPLAQARHKKAG